jgi:uncharacterized protein
VSKLLLLVIAAAVVYFLVSGYTRKRSRADASVAAGESMVPCAHCGVNVPRSEALESAGRFFCSEEHRRAASG